jgi:hypothetical protein
VGATVAAMGSDDNPGPRDDQGSEPPRPTELPGADAGELGAMLRRAAATGLPQVSTESHTVDPETGLAKEILGILGQGVGGAGGAQEVDPAELRALHERVREALRGQGIDPDSGVPRGDRR